MTYTLYLYLLYLAVSIGLTIWVGRTLHQHGRIFLVDAFLGNEKLADSINHLLLVGFYLINFGYVNLGLRYGERPESIEGMLEALTTKIGIVLLVLGGMHFFNLFVFSRMRRRAMLHNAPPPLAADDQLPVVNP